MTTEYDAIVVGARCAGSPTAMLLARQGYRVLLVDRATFPSDTPSTHAIHAPGIAALGRSGLLDAVTATRCRPIDSYRFDFGFVSFTRTPPPVDGISTCYAPRSSAAGGTPAGLRRRDVGYQATRDAQVRPIYEFTSQLATLAAPPPEMVQLLAGVIAGTVSPAQLLAPENVSRIVGAVPAA